jgi:hypothetical protein
MPLNKASAAELTNKAISGIGWGCKSHKPRKTLCQLCQLEKTWVSIFYILNTHLHILSELVSPPSLQACSTE